MLQTNVVLIVLFNYAYTFQQLDPKEMAEQLKRQGSSVQGIRPGKKTASYIAETLNRMSLLGSGFLGLLAAAPAGVEALTKLQVQHLVSTRNDCESVGSSVPNGCA